MASAGHNSDASTASVSPRHASMDASEDIERPVNTMESGSFTFVLNDPSQSQQAVVEKPAQYDRFAHTRTKRKRTSPADFAILEREYEREPRPDRDARVEIATRVSLNEKEVQIWFQNRRQMTRRKARTWQPNEISEIIRSSQQSSDSASPPSTQEQIIQTLQSTAASATERMNSATNEKPAMGLFSNTSPSSFQQAMQQSIEKPMPPIDNGDENDDEEEQEEKKQKQDGDRRSSPQSEPSDGDTTIDLGVESEPQSRISPEVHIERPAVQPRDKGLKRTGSKVRLRMSLDGKAELVLDKTTPSPPSKTDRRESWSARGPLRRSQSAFSPLSKSLEHGSTDVPASSQTSITSYESLRPLGRSRDARAWEFYCDTGGRDALSIAAEHDRRGSAQAALNLIRSNSGSAAKRLPASPLVPSFRKHNSFAGRKAQRQTNAAQTLVHEDGKVAEKRKSLENLQGSRPKLARTSSSVARLQSTGAALARPPSGKFQSSSQQARTKQKSRGFAILRDGDSDSDKENWRPGTRVSAPLHPRHASSGANSRSILGLNTSELSHEGSLGALMAGRGSGNARPQKAGQPGEAGVGMIQDDEVAAFMGEASVRGSSLSEEDDLDAVQNLLSLKQGDRWR